MNTNEELKKSISAKIAIEMLGLDKLTTDPTIEQVEEVQKVMQDAISKKPQTDLGKAVALKTMQEINKGADSKYYETDFDFTKEQNEKVRPVALEVLKLILEKGDIAIPHFGVDQERTKEHNKAIDDIAFNVLMKLNEYNVPTAYFADLFDKINASLRVIENQVHDNVAGHKTEIMSRLLGVRNPKFKTYDSRHATYKNILDLLEKVRQDTGNDTKDYFPN